MRKPFLVLTALVLFSCKTKQPAVFVDEPYIFAYDEPDIVEIEETPPVITDPEFEILSLAVIQADLVVTRFKTILKVINPNNFALNLSGLKYELYGEGLFWASGKAVDLLSIPENSSCETGFVFSMNFINMSRKLLDDIIALKKVRYRFLGEAEVNADIPDAAPFNITFERSGLSDVLK
jgi:LEA14-like dessication related protein